MSQMLVPWTEKGPLAWGLMLRQDFLLPAKMGLPSLVLRGDLLSEALSSSLPSTHHIITIGPLEKPWVAQHRYISSGQEPKVTGTGAQGPSGGKVVIKRGGHRPSALC